MDEGCSYLILKCYQCWDPNEDCGICFTLGSPFANLPTDLIGLRAPLSIMMPILKMDMTQRVISNGYDFLRVLRKPHGTCS